MSYDMCRLTRVATFVLFPVGALAVVPTTQFGPLQI